MMKICPPAMLYLILALIGFVYAVANHGQNYQMTLIAKLAFILIWTYLLNLLCQKGYTTVSWILVLLPIVLMIVILLLVSESVRHQNHSIRM